MKNAFYVLLLGGLIASCKSSNKNPVADSTSKITTTVNQGNKLIEKFAPLIQGVWVKKDYIEKVALTKSPLAAVEDANDITTMFINTDKIKGDSLMVSIGAGNHEGSEMILKFRPGTALSTLQFGDGDLGYTIEKGDTILFCSRFDEQQKKMITTKYVKALKTQPENDLGFGMNYMVNKALTSGTFIMSDTLGSAGKVIFTDDGKVSGFPGYRKYNINIDVNSDIRDNLDEISFDYDTKKNKSYSFKINADTIRLYTTRINAADSTELVLDKLVYKLVKQK